MKLIIISGPSGSGKTTLSVNLEKELRNSFVLSTDNYYKTGLLSFFLSKFIKAYFDKIISHDDNLLRKEINSILENRCIDYYYQYDFKKRIKRKLFYRINKIEYLIIEGIFTLELLEFLSKYNYLLIRLKTNKKICEKRVSTRDKLERGKKNINEDKEFNFGWNLFQAKEKKLISNKNKKELVFSSNPNIQLILNEIFKLNF
tara:strand:- start:170 stop:775 length:606 start_codon:yes stop_codon:yes gene_type:complete